ncbi:MAG TPA: bifunctional phosphoribosyl-AMP cyclohydrolase/phosphoribosyl-ATP diphosphatase HisIE [Buchnera sp. (in: enterobacteria)]|nr:bifunctional phosphoribosyl-AMP cyclohydrolase/phosphoribosyl-ATP diphosphatase HisIE [Buchnera sp. (in: enterobacteria)]
MTFLSKKNKLNVNWEKINGMLPAIVQNYFSGEVLMHGYMNSIALEKTISTKLVTFFSRKKKRLWIKGESSGNFLKVIDYILDCDKDTLLILSNPIGKTCHLNKKSCFFNSGKIIFSFLYELEKIIENRKNKKKKESYTYLLFKNGTNRIAQKLAEEAVETSLASVSNNKEEIINESSDLLYHLLVLLSNQKLSFFDVLKKLKNRNNFMKG